MLILITEKAKKEQILQASKDIDSILKEKSGW